MTVRSALCVAAILLAGCADTTTGRGQRGSESTQAPPSSPIDIAPPSTVTVTPSSSAEPPVPATRPAACPEATCTEVDRADLGDGYEVVLLGDMSQGGGAGVSVLELDVQGVPVFWAVKEGEIPDQLVCSATPAKNCVVVAYVGAHGALARMWHIVGSSAVAGDEADSGTATMEAVDLNGDGYIDVRGLQSTYEPDYATGEVYWQTWTSNGSVLTSTGCGPQAASKPPTPSSVLTGPCG